MWPVRGTFPVRGGKDLPSEDPRLVNEVMDLLTTQGRQRKTHFVSKHLIQRFFNLCFCPLNCLLPLSLSLECT